MSFGRIQPRKMARIILIALYCICLLLLESVSSLKCRTDVQQANDQFRNVLQVCKKRYAGNSNYDDSSLSDSDNNENSSNAALLDKLFMQSSNKFSNTQSWKEENNWNHGNNQKSGNEKRYSSNYMSGNERNTRYHNHDNNDRDFGYYDETTKSDYSQIYNSNSGSNYNKEREQACIVQCFFKELNMVDHRGFPEQNQVIQLITHNIQNSELQDFMEEAIIECFHYLSSNLKRDNCLYSQNLLSCLDDKGKERCEDWDN